MTIREQFEQEELSRLSDRAAKSVYSKGRARQVDACRVCIAFEAQKLEKVVEEDTDMPMDYVVTEAKVYTF